MPPYLRILPRGARPEPRPLAVLLALTASALLLALLLPAPGALAAATPSAPNVATSCASNATYSSVVVYGYVNPHGHATGYLFQYGTTTGYGGQTPLAAGR